MRSYVCAQLDAPLWFTNLVENGPEMPQVKRNIFQISRDENNGFRNRVSQPELIENIRVLASDG